MEPADKCKKPRQPLNVNVSFVNLLPYEFASEGLI